MSPAKRTTTTTPAKRASARTKKTTMDREVALPSESDHMQTEPQMSIETFAGNGAADDTEERIRQRAYEIYCSRSGGDGDALEDWLAAEREVRSGGTAPESHASILLESSSEDAGRDVAR